MAQLIDWLIIEPNGVDDTAQISQAVNDLNLSGGGEVRFREGTYILSSPITCKDGVSFIGIRPALTFGGNCPDLNFTAAGGTILRASTTGLTAFAANTTDTPGAVGAELEPLSNVRFKNMVVKGFYKAFDIGASGQLGMGMGGFESVYIDGTGVDNTTVQTQLAFDLTNCQQMTCNDVMIYKVRNGIRITNDHNTTAYVPQCSSGNSLWGKTYVYMDTDTTSEAASSISTITVGATTTIVTATAHGLSTGDVCQIAGVTGTDAAGINRVHKVESVTNSTTFVVDTTLTGKTLNNGTGTVEKGRVGIHLVSKGVEPLNHVTFIAPQVNFFVASQVSKGLCNIAISGTSSGGVGACAFIASDTEGKTDHHFYIDGASNCRFDIATVDSNSTEPALTSGHVAQWNCNSNTVNSYCQNTTVKFGSSTYTTSNSNLALNGVIFRFISGSALPTVGSFFSATDTATYIPGVAGIPTLEIDVATNSFGPISALTSGAGTADTWMAHRIMHKRNATKCTGDLNIAMDRMGYWECTNAGNATLTLPTIGVGSLQAPCGTIMTVSKFSGAGTVTIAPAAGNTIAGAASYTALLAVPGKSVTLMSGGYSDWVIIGQN